MAEKQSDPPLIDARDVACLAMLQEDAELPIQAIAERIALSPSATSRRVTQLRQAGFVRRVVALLDRRRLGVSTTVFLTVRAVHSEDWTRRFRETIADVPEIVEAHRLAGNLDYVLRVVIPSVEAYDTIYKRLIAAVPIMEVSAYFSMETLKEETALPLNHMRRS
ncbi:Lrp/AsnC family transcriptional regulator [Sphingomonas sp. GM_Shp_2]|uniref:Lrp/AsnC family transcriptional regulator n=1 Tax=Sphingomonas sp. GM_Shp_2 TaxID=2937380 RepID=UPI002269BEC9|nr:Lrp/AsnC family transcriptional regulator [Sphingomonas sp. GM_Shp_2]